MPSICEICLRRKIYYRRPYEGVYLCRQCFKKSIEKKIKKTVSKYKMLKHDDYIGVAVSGGKDSLTLLKILDKLSETVGHSSVFLSSAYVIIAYNILQWHVV